MLHEYKRRQMEFEDHEWCRYNLEPAVLPAAYRFYFETQCAIGVSELVKAGLGQLSTMLVCGVGGGADLQYWLWKIVGREGSKDAALHAYEGLYQRIPKFEFVKRIAELKGERIPMSADDLGT